jgi:nicotinamide riboside transporter PnuC
MGELTDLIFTIMGKLGLWFNVKGQRVCFVLWGIFVAYWMARNIQLGLISQTLGCVVSLGFHVYGYISWTKKNIGK